MKKLRQLNYKHYLSLFVVLFILLALPLTVIQTLNSRDSRSQAATTPNDYNYALNQWNLKLINVDKVWDITTGSSTTVVATIGTGVDATHPDLDGKLVPGWNIVANNSNTDDDYLHGFNTTFAAGIIGAETNNTIGVAGIDWQTKIMPVKICDWQFCKSEHLGPGIRWAVDNGADVISVALFYPENNPTVESAVLYAESRGVPVIAGTGNYATGVVQYPAAYPSTISVGITDKNDVIVSYSGKNPDLVAPGIQIPTTSANSNYTSATGTMFSAAHVSGVLALLLAKNVPVDIATKAVIEGAKDLGATGIDQVFGNGRLDACGAFQRASVLLSRSDLACPVASVGDPTPPTKPTNLRAMSKVSGVRLLWNPSTDNIGVTGYRVVRNSTTLNTSVTNSYLDSSATSPFNYTYKVVALDAAGNVSPDSNSSQPIACSKLDVNGDGLINTNDANTILTYFGDVEDRGRYNPKYDVNANRNVDLSDALLVLQYNGESCS